ncbi:unnamed protein product [Parnassius apollo]|uniref:(apollo) hypothetical protein n=1 Tax=Parnassius apollo TaxID=110799 RepID=A0A8S3X200_PARAO|nr:unnamed protein product [Parnassius apollo]
MPKVLVRITEKTSWSTNSLERAVQLIDQKEQSKGSSKQVSAIQEFIKLPEKEASILIQDKSERSSIVQF